MYHRRRTIRFLAAAVLAAVLAGPRSPATAQTAPEGSSTLDQVKA